MIMSDKAVVVPMEVTYRGAWLTWVASTTSCLEALGTHCDTADVAGLSGYAFVLAVHHELCPSGPTMFDWGMLDHGVNFLGRSTKTFSSSDCHTRDTENDRTRAHCRAAYEMVAREVAAGRPCVLWGAYVPEFAVVVGVENDAYHVRSFRQVVGQEEEPIPYDALDAPGGPYVMAFPTPTDIPRGDLLGDRFAVGHAVALLRGRSPFREFGFGLRAYDTWIAALDANRQIDFGNAYNAQCWAEGRAFARTFLERVAARQPSVADRLRGAVNAYAEAEGAMRRFAGLFPFPASGESRDPARRAAGATLLRDAQTAETKAVEELERTVDMDWGI